MAVKTLSAQKNSGNVYNKLKAIATRPSFLLQCVHTATFTDASPNAASITAQNGVTTSTSTVKFTDTVSAYFDGSNDYLEQSGSASQYAFGTGNFTVEFWIYALSATNRQGLYTNNTSSLNTGPVFAIRGSGTTGVLGVGSVGNADNVQTSSNAFSVNTWHHVALVRTGTGTNQTKIYVDGVEKAAGTLSDNYSTARAMNLGRTFHYGEYFNGYLQDVRITKAAVYTAAFTPPGSFF